MTPVVSRGGTSERGGQPFGYTYGQQPARRGLAPVVVGRTSNPLFDSSQTLLPTRILPPTCTSPSAAHRWHPAYQATEEAILHHQGALAAQRAQESQRQQQWLHHVTPMPSQGHYYMPQPQRHIMPPPRVISVPHPQPQPVMPNPSYAPFISSPPEKPSQPPAFDPNWRCAPAEDNQSSSASDEGFMSCSEDDCRPDGCSAEPFCPGIMLLKGSDPDALYIDPTTEGLLTLTNWVKKFGYAPRPSLFRGESTKDDRRKSSASETKGWPSSTKSQDSPSAGGSKGSNFAQLVREQNARLSAARDSSGFATSPASPDPDPSGPLPMYQRSDSFTNRSATAAENHEDEPDPPADDDIDETRAAVKSEQLARALAALKAFAEAAHGGTQTETPAQPLFKSMERLPESILQSHEYEDLSQAPVGSAGFAFTPVLTERLSERSLDDGEAIQRVPSNRERTVGRSEVEMVEETLTRREEETKVFEKEPAKLTPGNAMDAYLLVATHGITAISFRLESIAYISSAITEALTADCVVYAVVKLGEQILHGWLRFVPISLRELCDLSKSPENSASDRLTWNDVFHFPYLNERYLSCTIRLKELGEDATKDYLVGAARIDLEAFIFGDANSALHTIQTFDSEGRATARVVVSIVPSTDVLKAPCLSVRPHAMDAAAVAVSTNLSTSFFPMGDSQELSDASSVASEERDPQEKVVDEKSRTPSEAGRENERRGSLESVEAILTLVPWRAINVVAHKYLSLCIGISGLKGLKLGSRTSAAALAIEASLADASGVIGSLQTSAHRVQVQRTKKNRLFAFVNYNEEMRLPFSSQRLLTFRCWNIRAQPERTVVGEAVLNLQDLLLMGLQTAKRKLSLTDRGRLVTTSKCIGYLDVIIDFSTEAFFASSVRPIPTETICSSDKDLSLGFEKPSEVVTEDVDPPSTCHVTIEELRDLRLVDKDSAHPYVRVKLGRYEARTARGASSTCRFRAADAQFAFDLEDNWQLQLLTLECFNKSDIGEVDRLVGVCVLPLTDLKRLPYRSFCGDLRLLDKHGEDVGIVRTDCQLLH